MRFLVRNRKKPRQPWSFRSSGRKRYRRLEPKVLTQFAIHMADKKLKCINPVTGTNKKAAVRFPVDSKPRASHVHNPFIMHQLFCPFFRGNRREGDAEQTRIDKVATENNTTRIMV
jgi:hypothetical protein